MEDNKNEFPKVRTVVNKLDLGGIRTHYDSHVWVDDKNDPEGGFRQPVRLTLEKPQIHLDFKGTVDVILRVNGIYSDGYNLFQAISPNEIINRDGYIRLFRIPKRLTLVSSTYIKGRR